MTIELHVPGLKEMAARQAWLSDPRTMDYNRGRELGGAEGYDPATGCIDFSRENWRYWRQVWLFNEPDFYSAYIRDAERDCFVGEVCWFREGEDFTAGILIAAQYRRQGYCAPALRLLAERAFQREDIPCPSVRRPGGEFSRYQRLCPGGFCESRGAGRHGPAGAAPRGLGTIMNQGA